jgi:hypothetical protein
MAEVRLECLVGRRVVDAEGRSAGRIEEVIARREGQALVVTEYRLGVYALLHRLAGGSFGRALLGVLPFTRPTIYRVPWHEMDLSDPERPRIRCARDALESAA